MFMANEKAFTGPMNQGMDTSGAYEVSFGRIRPGTVYHSPDSSMLPQLKAFLDEGMKRVMQLKALSGTSGGTGTAGYGMFPVYVDGRVVDRSRKYTPSVEMIQRVTNQGLTADYNALTAKGGAVTAVEDAALNETTDTYARASTAIKYLYSVGRVTGPALAAMPSYMLEGMTSAGGGLGGSPFNTVSAPNAKQLEVLVKAQSMKELEESLIVNGSASSDATQYSGIVTLMSTTNTVAKSTAAIEWGDVELAIRYAYDDSGRVTWALASSDVVKDLRKIIIDTYHYRPADMAGTLPFGVPVSLVLETMVGPVPVIPSQYLSNTNGSKAIYFLDGNSWQMRVLQDMTYEDLAHSNDSEKFMLKIYEALICTNTSFNASVTAISA